jgi:pilus assembly protein CpaE
VSHPADKDETGATLVIAVNVAPDICAQLERAVGTLYGRTSFTKCDSYISTARRPLFLSSIKASESSIIFIDFDRSTEQAIESAQYLTQAYPGKISVVALGRARDPGSILNAMRAGCCEFLGLPLQSSSLIELFDRLDRKRASAHGGRSQAGSVISFCGVKGGVGVTTIATHFAVYLAHCYQKRTLLIDSRPALGHVAIYLGMNSDQSLFRNVVQNLDRLDSELLDGFLAEHSSGLYALTSPDALGDAVTINEEAVAKAIEFFRGEFDYVVVDCGMPHQERSAPFIAASQHLYLVVTPEVGAIRDLSRHIDQLALRDSTLDKVELILNRVSRSDVIQSDQIQKSTGRPIAMCVPSMGREFVRACNLGTPLLPSRKVPFTAILSEWVAQVAGAAAVFEEVEENKLLSSFKRTSSSASPWKKGFAYNERH